MLIAHYVSPILPFVGLGFTFVAIRLLHRVVWWPGRKPHFLQRFVTYMMVTYSVWAIFVWAMVAYGGEGAAASIWDDWGLALQVPIIAAGVLLDLALGHMPPRINGNND